MKKLTTLLLAACFCTIASAQTVVENDYDGSLVQNGNAINTFADDEKESIDFSGLAFYSYEGGENYGLSFDRYTFNGFGGGANFRAQFKKYGNYNADILANYSFGLYKNDNVTALLTIEAGPSIRDQNEYDAKKNKDKDKFYIDGFVGVKASVKFNKVMLSAGYHIWAPQFKFGKNYKADGFYAQLGVSI